MEILFKTGALLILSSAAALLIRRTNPELSLAVSLCAVSIVLAMSLSLLGAAAELRNTARRLYGVSDVYTLPVLKCCAAAIISRLTAELCRDASQSAAAYAIELIGALCALAVSMPLISSMLDAIGEML